MPVTASAVGAVAGEMADVAQVTPPPWQAEGEDCNGVAGSSAREAGGSSCCCFRSQWGLVTDAGSPPESRLL